ncbi:MAG: hypothetical protein WBO34_04740 [Gammaproteobacteria bacterium]
MKISTGFILLLFPAISIAQDYQGMSEQDMQNMMQHMQEMQNCMQSVDQSKMEALEQRTNTLQAEVESLCANGERDAANKKALAFAQEMSSDPDILRMRKCGEKMRGMMPQLPYMEQTDAREKSGSHVCD